MATLDQIAAMANGGCTDWSSNTTYIEDCVVCKNNRYFIALDNAETNKNKDPEDVQYASFWTEIL